MAQKPRSAELHPGPGFRVRMDFERPDPAVAEAFAPFATPDISDLLNRLYAVDPAVRCLTGDRHRLCGPACTVKVFPGDNLMVHKALDVRLKPEAAELVDYLIRATSVLEGKLGPVLFQLPPNLKKDVGRLQTFLPLLKSAGGGAIHCPNG